MDKNVTLIGFDPAAENSDKTAVIEVHNENGFTSINEISPNDMEILREDIIDTIAKEGGIPKEYLTYNPDS